MSGWLVAALVMVATYLAGLAALLVAGRGSDARAVARLVPDCLRLARRLARDPHVPRVRRLSLLALVATSRSPSTSCPTSSRCSARSTTR